MKRILKYFVFMLIFLLPAFFMTACDKNTVIRLESEYIGNEYSYDKVHGVITVLYTDNVSLNKEDFSVYEVTKGGKKNKLSDFVLDLRTIENRVLIPGSYAIRIASKDEKFETNLTLEVVEKEVDRPTVTSYETEYTGTAVDISKVIKNFNGFDNRYMEILPAAGESLSMTNAGQYKAVIRLKDGFAWRTSSSRFADIEVPWSITKKVVPLATFNGSSVLEYKFSSSYEGVAQLPEIVYNQDLVNLTYDPSINVGNYELNFKIKDEYKANYVFANGETSHTLGYQIVKAKLDTVVINGESQFEYTGSIVVPSLSNFIGEIMELSDYSNNIKVGAYSLDIWIKEEYSSNFEFANAEVVHLAYNIGKKYLARPNLAKTHYTYTGETIDLEFNNFDPDYFVTSDTSQNIEASVRAYPVTISLKPGLDSSCFAYIGEDSIYSITENYFIDKAYPLVINIGNSSLNFKLFDEVDSDTGDFTYGEELGIVNYVASVSKNDIPDLSESVLIEFVYINNSVSEDGKYIVVNASDDLFYGIAGSHEEFEYIDITNSNQTIGSFSVMVTEDRLEFAITTECIFNSYTYAKITINLV